MFMKVLTEGKRIRDMLEYIFTNDDVIQLSERIIVPPSWYLEFYIGDISKSPLSQGKGM
jgi:hypothetical protein